MPTRRLQTCVYSNVYYRYFVYFNIVYNESNTIVNNYNNNNNGRNGSFVKVSYALTTRPNCSGAVGIMEITPDVITGTDSVAKSGSDT